MKNTIDRINRGYKRSKHHHGKLTHDEYGYLMVWLVWSCREIRMGTMKENYLVAVCTDEDEARLREEGIKHGSMGPNRLCWVEQVQTNHMWGEMMERSAKIGVKPHINIPS